VKNNEKQNKLGNKSFAVPFNNANAGELTSWHARGHVLSDGRASHWPIVLRLMTDDWWSEKRTRLAVFIEIWRFYRKIRRKWSIEQRYMIYYEFNFNIT
jgi:hypothetical protein